LILAGSPRIVGAVQLAVSFGDLVGKFGLLVVECPKCSRTGHYPLPRTIEQRGRGVRIQSFYE